VLALIIQILDSVRSDTPAEERGDPEALARAARSLSTTITRFLGELVGGSLAAISAQRVLVLDRRQDHLQALLETASEFAAAAGAASAAAAPARVFDALKESLSILLLAVQDGWQTRDPAERDLVLKLSADRGDMLERLRQRIASTHADRRDASSLFYATALFERAVWLVRQIAIPLVCGARAAMPVAPTSVPSASRCVPERAG
jgi:phosphate:Na+ symporter